MSPFAVLLRRLTGRERRGARRKTPASLVAYYWDGAAPTAFPVRDVSVLGLYLETEQRWYPRTMVTMRLQEPSLNAEAGNSIELIGLVTRAGNDGVGFRFVSDHSNGSPSNKALKNFVDTLEEKSNKMKRNV